ncbi:MAG: phage scaffolding protein [Lachnospiraceae bacterium]|nr:phage scaffolding protein [Lachnospiraceae bacterium]
MTKEQLTALGISEELAGKAAAQSEEELKNYVAKHQYEEVCTEKENLKKTIKENEAALEELKESAGDATSLTEQIQKLQKEAKEKETAYQKEVKELRMNNAIKLALTGKVHDEELTAGLIDKTKLILGEDGTVTGLEEQMKALKESKAFLFKEDGKETENGGAGGKHYTPKGGKTNDPSLAKTIAAAFNESVAENPYTKAWS